MNIQGAAARRGGPLCRWALGAAVLLAGCARRPETPAPAPPPRVVRVLNWEEYIEPSLLSEFTRQTGVQVEYHTFATQDELSGAIRSDPSAYDLIIVDDSVIDTLRDLQLLRPIDSGRLAGLVHVGARWLNPPDDPGNRYSIPYLWGTTLLAYRKDKVAGTPQRWTALWDERYRGRIMMLRDFQENFGIALLSLGYPMNSGETRHLGRARERLLEQAPMLLGYGSGSEVKAALLAGEAWIAALYSGDAAMAAQEDDRIGYVLPAEGAPLWLDGFALPRDALHVEEAMALIDFLLQPEIAARNAGYLRYATPNDAARPRLDADLLADAAIFPPDDALQRCAFYVKPDEARLRVYNTTASAARGLLSRAADPPP